MMSGTSVIDALQPRDPESAGRTACVLGVVAASVTMLLGVAQSAAHDAPLANLVITAGVAGVIVTLAWAARRLDGSRRSTWAAAPLIATAVIVALDFFSQDSSLPAQVFLLFPALFAASQLRRAGVAMVVTAVVAAEGLITFGMQPWHLAVIDAGYMVSAIVATAALLLLAEEDRERLVTRLQRLAAVDPLTGLVTRRVLDDAARAALSGAASAAGTALILIDVDNFKAINDTYGHPAGDEVLIQLAAALTESAEPTDIISRLGGDEIALLLPGCSAYALAQRSNQLFANLRATVFTLQGGRSVAVSVSGGVAHVPTDASDLRSLYAAADGALYRAKSMGRDRFHAASFRG